MKKLCTGLAGLYSCCEDVCKQLVLTGREPQHQVELVGDVHAIADVWTRARFDLHDRGIGSVAFKRRLSHCYIVTYY